MKHDIRVYWEDTDAGGIVYYANYLKFSERARTEWLRQLGFEQQSLKDSHQIMIVVKRAEVEYLRPARLDDLLTIDTQLQEQSKLRMTMRQIIKRGEETLAEVLVELVCVNIHGKPTPFPEPLMTAFIAL
jgi:acyl-CoA thioester hydrolase